MERARRAGDHQGTRSTLATDWSISAGMARLFGSWRRRRDLSLPLDTSTSGITRHKLRPAATSRPLLRRGVGGTWLGDLRVARPMLARLYASAVLHEIGSASCRERVCPYV